MNDIPFDAIGFDLDGTLLDTHKDLGMAVNHALQLGGFTPVPVESSKDLIGGGAKVMLGRAVDAQGGMAADEFHDLYKAMLRYYADHNAVYSRPYPGVIAALDELEAVGMPMAVVTNKFEGFARSILEELDLAKRFVTIIGGDTMGKDANGKNIAKPAPDPVIEARKRCAAERFVFIGDSSFDINAARSAGVPAIVAAYGYCDKPPHELGGDAIIDRFEELIPALRAL